jgi:glycosyltransferase involved in cell wall biosynthesis
MQLVFWHNIISPHQAPFLRELAASGHEVLVVATEAMSVEREQLGWSPPELGSAQVILGPDQARVRLLVKQSGSDAIHFLAGARGTELGRQVAHVCRSSGRRMGLITESPDARGLGGPLRWVKYAGERVTMGKYFEFILAMGQRGVRWFRRCGYPASRVFPFAYVTERFPQNPGPSVDGDFHFLFVGQLIHRKGVDLLLRALALVSGCKVSVIGDGPEREKLIKLAAKCGLNNRVLWHGKMGSTQAQSEVCKADMLVLPSREDGWGAVVNESLMSGIPVICSSACGAADLITAPWLGTVFPAGNVSGLAAALNDSVKQGKASLVQRQHIRDWSQCIEGVSVAKYVEQILGHVYGRGPRPRAPWRSAERLAMVQGAGDCPES